MIKLDIGPIAPSRKTLKKGIEFNIMVVGESGLGKTTLINTLLNTNMRSSLSNHKELEKTVTIEVNTLELEERGSKIRLSIIDTPGFGNSLNNSNAIEPLVTYIDSQLANYFQDEIGLNRRSLVDNRVHICLYFIEPMHRGLKPLDIKFMQAVQNKVNVFPLLAKADAYTNQELIDMKRQVIKDLSSHEIKIYEFPECDSDDDPDFVKINEEMKKLMPFSVVGGLETLDIAGKIIQGRKYAWGFVNINDETHSDFIYLRNMLLRTHMNDLLDVTSEIHYENFRTSMLSQNNPYTNFIGTPFSSGTTRSYPDLTNKENGSDENLPSKLTPISKI